MHALRGELSRVEPQFGRVTGAVTITSRPIAPTGGVATGEGYVWAVYGDSTLARIRPASIRIAGSTLTGSGPAAVVVAAGAVWVANSGDATVQRFNPATFEEGPVRTTNVGRQPSGMAYGEGALWVANRGDDTVTRIDARAGSIEEIIGVGDGPTAVAVGAGAVWVANSRGGTISRIDPESNEVVRTIRIGSRPAGVAVAEGLVWVAAQAP